MSTEALLIAKILFAIVGAVIATVINLSKEPKDDASKIKFLGRWRLTKAGGLAITGLWLVILASLVADLGKYTADKQKEAKDAAAKQKADEIQKLKDAALKDEKRLTQKWQDSVNQRTLNIDNRARQIKQDTADSLSQIRAAQQGLDEARQRLADVRDEQKNAARQARQTLRQVNNSIQTGQKTLRGVNQAIGTGAKTLQGVNAANGNLAKSLESASRTLIGLEKTHREVLRAARPLRPLDMIVHIDYSGSAVHAFAEQVDNWVTEWEHTAQNRRTSERLAQLERDFANQCFMSTPSTITLWDDSYLTESIRFQDLEARRICGFLTTGDIGVSIAPQKALEGPIQEDSVQFYGYAIFKKNRFKRTKEQRLIPRPGDLEIKINRRTKDLVVSYFVKQIGPEGSVFGIHSLYDFKDKWFALKLPGQIFASDKPHVTYCSYRNDTFVTDGKFPESIVFLNDAFSPAEDLPNHNSHPQGVVFWHEMKEEDLNSAVKLENQRRNNQLR